MGIPFLPGEYPQAEITLPPAPVQLPMRMQGQHPDEHLLVPMEHGHGKMLLGEGRRNWGRLWGWHSSSAPTYFLILLIQVFQKCIQLILINEAISILDSVGGTSTAGRTQAPQFPLGYGHPQTSPSTARGKPSSPTSNQSRNCPNQTHMIWGYFLPSYIYLGQFPMSQLPTLS